MEIHNPEPDDDLQIEVSSLHPPPTTKKPSVDAVDAVDAAADRPLFVPIQVRLAQRQRGIIVTTILVVALVALVLTIAPTREALLGTVFGPTPTLTAPVPAGEDHLYVALTPQWGSVTLDERPLSRLPLEGIDQPFQLARGVHVIHWRFPPIIDVSCRLTVPTALGDTCPLRVGILPGKKGIASVVTLQLSLANLVPAYRVTLLAAIRAALAAQESSDVVRVGEHYVDLTHLGMSIVATQPLRATVHFVSDLENLDTQCHAITSGPGTNCAMRGDCREICTAPWQAPPTAWGGVWQAYIVAHESWSYTTLRGRVVTTNQPDIGGNLSFLNFDEHPVPVSISWDGSGWQVGAQFNATSSTAGSPFVDPACMTAQDEVVFKAILPPARLGGVVGVGWLYVPGAPRALGCLTAALPVNGQGAPDTSKQSIAKAGLILHRFGVPLAANMAAQRDWPELPVADGYEQAIAESLAQQLSQRSAAAGAG
jgi:hypothetical protein